MQIIDNTSNPAEPAPPAAPLSVSGASNYTPPSYAIAPEDQALADEIATFTMEDVPSDHSITGAVVLRGRITAKAFAPETRDRIMAEVAQVPADRAAAVEDRLVLEELRKRRMDNLVKNGPNTPDLFQQERFALVGELERLDAEFNRLSSELAEVARMDTEYDPAGRPIIDPSTGAPKRKTTYRYEGDARRAKETRSAEIIAHIAALEGGEGKRRLDKALYEEVERRKEIQQQLADHAEIERRAREKVREDRIEKAATQRARIKGASV